jgi:ABC-2 type transport system permease protein
MQAITKLTHVEAKLLFRDRSSLVWGLVFPAVLLLALGFFFPGFRDPLPDAGGLRVVDVYAPIVVAVGVTSLGLVTLPTYMAEYRSRGVLRRLATTPVPPRHLVFAMLAVHVSTTVAGAALALIAGTIAFDIPLPANPAGFALALVLTTTALFAIGLLIGVLAPTPSAAQGIGLLIYFPSLFFAGVYFPRDAMPGGLRAVSDLTPSGAGVEAMQMTWLGSTLPGVDTLLVLVVVAAVAGVVAARFFRWE